MVLEVYKTDNGASISFVPQDEPISNKNLLLGDDPVLFFSVEGKTIDECMQLAYDKLDWGEYKPMDEDF